MTCFVSLRGAQLRRAALTATLLTALLAATAVSADSVSKIYIGTLSNPLTAFGATAGNNPGEVARGNKYVIKTTFDTSAAVQVSAANRDFQSREFWSIALDDAPGGSNTFELFIPSEGFGGVLTQTGQDHFAISATTAQSAEIHFFSQCTSAATCASEFRGFEFESNFIRTNSPAAPDPTGDIIFELRDTDANLSGTLVTNQVVNVLDGDPLFALNGIVFNAGTTDVRSESNSPSGGQQNPGVFLSEAVAVVAEAGASPLVFSAGALSVTTNAGTERVTETAAPIIPGQLRTAPSANDEQPRQADNDLGAGRGDGEDFLSFQWTAGGASVAGNEAGTRLKRTVTTLNPGGNSFDNDGERAVDDVNITRSLAQSGLQNTTDTTTFEVLVTESITGLSDTDTVTVSYANTGPTASAGGGLVFDAGNFLSGVGASGSANDDDLVANAEVAGFETLSAQFSIGATNVGVGQNLGSPVAGPIAVNQNLKLADVAVPGGLNMTTAITTLDLEITDFAGATASAGQTVSYANAAPMIASAGHTVEAGFDIRFALNYNDADLAVNDALGIADFELLMVEIRVDNVDQTGFFANLIGAGGTSQLVANAELISMFGLGSHLFELKVADRVMVDASVLPLLASFNFEVSQVPVPAPLGLLALGLAALGGLRRKIATHMTGGR